MYKRSETLVLVLHLTCLLYHQTTTAAGGLPSPYTPVDSILINCGFTGISAASDGRIWLGDVYTRFSPLESQNQTSLTGFTDKISPSAPEVPYATARFSFSGSPFTYMFPVTEGPKFIRLYFYPTTYSNFDPSNALFSVKANGFTLLSSSLTADSNGYPRDTIFREYFINIKKDQRLNITFTPSGSNSYAFINGIEILSMPYNLYYIPSADEGFPFIGQQSLYSLDDRTIIQMIYRLNVGGRNISPSEDTGMFRSWSQDDNYLTEHKQLVLPMNPTIELKFSHIPAYTAPDEVYQTARSMGTNKTINKSYNLTWEFPVDSGFVYLVRLHFCEFQPEITQASDREFLIFIADQIAEEAADVIKWSGGNGIPVYKDYAVSMFGQEGEKKMNLSLALQANPGDEKTVYNDAILNGVEIFKISAGHDPLRKKSKNNITSVAIVGGGVFGFVVLSILGFIIFRQGKKMKNSGSTTKSIKTCRSTPPSDQCRHFSLAKIKAATNDFDKVLIIGAGGFGNVYKGYIDNGTNLVAIKRLTPGSQQGAQEFQTEIEMLSQLRHRHLVSLIGYCNDGNEMILVYDYMAHGTLRDHLYSTDNPPLPWKQRLEICIGAARGLNYLHTGAKHTIIHRDVKTTNILLDEKWIAKVSDFGLSKMGPNGMSNTHVSTVVKGTFGYMDPEYYRHQQLSLKSDVYSFGIVLCEVLCARPPIVRIAEMQVQCLAEWAPRSYRNGEVDQIVDPSIKGEIAVECLKKFAETAVNCLHDNGINRPSMNDVVRDLELALKLQQSADKDVGLEEEFVLPKSTFDSKDVCSSSCGQDFSEIMNPQGR